MKQRADAARLCSGLLKYPDINKPQSCAKRSNCQRYVHWTVDRRSEFNLCAAGRPAEFAMFIPIGVSPAKPGQPQLELF